MIQKNLAFVGLFLIAFPLVFKSCKTDSTYKYKIDLARAKKNYLFIELLTPKQSKDSAVFHFAKMDPGHWANHTNFGLYTEEFKAFNYKGEDLRVEKRDTNSYVIFNAKELKYITYKYYSTWADTVHKKNKFVSCVGTHFIPESFYLINGGIFGFIEGDINSEFEVEITNTLPTSLCLGLNHSKKEKYYNKFNSFYDLYDNPILIGDIDTFSFNLDQTKFLIAVYNEQNVKLSKIFAERIKPQIEALKSFSGNDLPVSEYTYYFYVKDFTQLNDYLLSTPRFNDEAIGKSLLIEEKYNGYQTSALEHKNSSLFTIIADEKNQTEFSTLDYALHEFLHVFTPKSISTDIHREFNFINPTLSDHRWLYEGVVEYFSGLAKVQQGIMTKETFLQDFIRPKLVMSSFFPNDFSFAQMSRNANKSPYKHHYFQFYERGPILALFLDIEIIRLTKGDKSLKDIFFSVYRQCKTKELTESDLVEAFVSQVHPDLFFFFQKYIYGTDPLPVKEYLSEIGVEYIDIKETKVPDLKLSVDQLFQYYIVNSSEVEGIEPGDKLDTRIVGINLRKPFTKDDGTFYNENHRIKIPIIRNSQKMIITTTAKLRDGKIIHSLSFSTKLDKTQKEFQEKWIGKN